MNYVHVKSCDSEWGKHIYMCTVIICLYVQVSIHYSTTNTGNIHVTENIGNYGMFSQANQVGLARVNHQTTLERNSLLGSLSSQSWLKLLRMKSHWLIKNLHSYPLFPYSHTSRWGEAKEIIHRNFSLHIFHKTVHWKYTTNSL